MLDDKRGRQRQTKEREQARKLKRGRDGVLVAGSPRCVTHTEPNERPPRVTYKANEARNPRVRSFVRSLAARSRAPPRLLSTDFPLWTLADPREKEPPRPSPPLPIATAAACPPV